VNLVLTLRLQAEKRVADSIRLVGEKRRNDSLLAVRRYLDSVNLVVALRLAAERRVADSIEALRISALKRVADSLRLELEKRRADSLLVVRRHQDSVNQAAASRLAAEKRVADSLQVVREKRVADSLLLVRRSQDSLARLDAERLAAERRRDDSLRVVREKRYQDSIEARIRQDALDRERREKWVLDSLKILLDRMIAEQILVIRRTSDSSTLITIDRKAAGALVGDAFGISGYANLVDSLLLVESFNDSVCLVILNHLKADHFSVAVRQVIEAHSAEILAYIREYTRTLTVKIVGGEVIHEGETTPCTRWEHRHAHAVHNSAGAGHTK